MTVNVREKQAKPDAEEKGRLALVPLKQRSIAKSIKATLQQMLVKLWTFFPPHFEPSWHSFSSGMT